MKGNIKASASFEGILLQCFQMKDGSKQYFTMDGMFLNINSFDLNTSKAIPIVFDEYNHVKIINSEPENMSYSASPHHLLNQSTTFEMYIEKTDGKEWGIMEKDDGNGLYSACMYYKNSHTENVSVTYTKFFNTRNACIKYSDNAVFSKVQKKGYVSQGKKTFTEEDFNPYI